MKRRIEDLGLHEAIHLIADKYSKSVCKNAKRENMNYGYIIRDFYRDNFFSWVRDIEGRYPIITAVYPASDFIRKPKKSRLDKIEERLKALEKGLPSTVTYSEDGKVSIRISEQDMPQPKLINYGGVEEVLTELPEKWCVKMHDQSVVDYCNINGVYAGSYNINPYNYAHFPACDGEITEGSRKYEGYTEITTEQFKKWVLGEENELRDIWYIHPKTKALLFVPNNMKCYGFDENREWIEIDRTGLSFSIWKPATEQEVSDALIAEAKRRGFKAGYASGWYEYFIQKGYFFYKNIENKLYVNQNADAWNIIFHNGVWAPLKETEIDWSKPGQLVKGKDVIILTSGHGTTEAYDSFSGIVVNSVEIYKKGHYSGTWNASQFKLYTGEPITLTP